MKVSVPGFTVGLLMPVFTGAVHARDEGRYANSPLKAWFDGLRSGKGPCCSDADGFAISDPDWESKSGHSRVRIDNEWIDVPDDAVITEPNRGWQDDSLAGHGVSWDFNPLLHARQHDLIEPFDLHFMERMSCRRCSDIGQRIARHPAVRVLECSTSGENHVRL
jgi:hypothetical protein